MKQPERPEPDGEESYVGDATEIPTRTQRIAGWLAERAMILFDRGEKELPEGDPDHFYYGPNKEG